MNELQEKLDVIAKYHELKPLYDVAMQQVKNEILESKTDNQFVLPSGAILTLKYVKEHDKTLFDSKRLKAEMPDIYDAYHDKISHVDATVSATVSYPNPTDNE